MATDPKIKFDIEANATGQESIQDLTRRLDELGREMGGELGQQASQAAARLRELGQQQEAINQFGALQRELKNTSTALTAAEREAANFGRQISTADPPTAQQAAARQKLRDAAEGVRTKLQSQKEAASTAEAALTRYGISSKNTGAAQERLRADAEGLRASLDKTALAFDATAQHGQAVAAERPLPVRHRSGHALRAQWRPSGGRRILCRCGRPGSRRRARRSRLKAPCGRCTRSRRRPARTAGGQRDRGGYGTRSTRMPSALPPSRSSTRTVACRGLKPSGSGRLPRSTSCRPSASAIGSGVSVVAAPRPASPATTRRSTPGNGRLAPPARVSTSS